MRAIHGVALVALAGLIASCSNFNDCEHKKTCDPPPGSGGAAQGGGGSGAAGLAGGGGDSASNAGGQGGGEAGKSGAGAGGEAPCNDDCGGNTPVCDAAANVCVECLTGDHCQAPRPACDVATNTCVECVEKDDCVGAERACDMATNSCVECTDSTDCKDSSKPLCDQTERACVTCLADADCKDPVAARCDTGTCKPCTASGQCTHLAGKGVCDVAPGQCVQCTGSDYGACGKDVATQTPLVCDSLKRTCTSNSKGTAGPCAPCVSDAQCKPGQTCVLDKFGAKTVGYFCHWKKGDTANGAPDDCFATGRPYASALASVTSIDGQTSDICMLRSSSCIAENQFSSKDCKSGALGDDSLCGIDPPNDAKCAQVPLSASFACTMVCLSDKDCPGTAVGACDTNATPKVCRLN